MVSSVHSRHFTPFSKPLLPRAFLRLFAAMLPVLPVGSIAPALAGESHLNGNPNWSPAGSEIVFSSDRSGNGDLYVLDAESLDLRLLVGGDAKEIHASWSPDGTQVAFDSDRSGNLDIWRIDASGSNITQLTRTPDSIELVPSWSPDGGWILFNRMMDDGFDIFVVDMAVVIRNDSGSDLYELSTSGEILRRLTD